MDITKALETGSIGYILIVCFIIAIVMLWRQNIFLTKELLKLAEKTNQVLSELRVVILTKKE